MSGMRKQKEYDWKDSNVALFGSDLDKQVKKSAAETEPAWKGTENLIGTRIWRIEKFEVKDWPKEKYGRFFNGDSYIILHGEKAPDSEEILFDVHFWIGKNSSQDEYGTAAYKTVELDTYLDDFPVQHREVQDCESEEFLSYFPDGIIIEGGGIESGFNHVDLEEVFSFKDSTLIHFKKINGKYQPVYLEYLKENLYCDDGYMVLLAGYRVIQVKGPNAKLDMIVPFNKWLTKEKEGYPKAEHVVYDSWEEFMADTAFTDLFPYRRTKANFEAPSLFEIKLIRVLTEGTNPEFVEVARGAENICRCKLDKNDVFLLEAPNRVFVWIGRDASSKEKKNALSYATTYCQTLGQDKKSAISCMKQDCGKKPALFNSTVKDECNVCAAAKKEKQQTQQGKTGRHNLRK